jgi:TonB family protein
MKIAVGVLAAAVSCGCSFATTTNGYPIHVADPPVIANSTGEDDAPITDNKTPGLIHPVPIKLEEANFPTAAANKGEWCEGVGITFTVTKAGKVLNPIVTDSCPDFDHNALQTVKNWTFKPAMLNSKPVAVRESGKISFMNFQSGSHTTVNSNLCYHPILKDGTEDESVCADAPVAVHTPEAEWPEEPFGRLSKSKQIPIVVHFMAIIGVDGAVKSVRNISTSNDPAFEPYVKNAQEAVKTWKFKPAMLHGTPVTVWMPVEVLFVKP